jgi:hypothetical protein
VLAGQTGPDLVPQTVRNPRFSSVRQSGDFAVELGTVGDAHAAPSGALYAPLCFAAMLFPSIA